MPVYYFYRTVIPAHGTGVSICRHPFFPDCAGTRGINGHRKLTFPVKITSGMPHLEVCFPGLFEFNHIADMGCYSGADNTFKNSVSYTHLRAHETGRNLVCRL